MQIKIFADEILIGRSNLDQLDPPMGVAMGSFFATDAYDRTLHANVIEGDHIGDRGKMLFIQSSDHGRIECAAISIEDYSDGLGEIEISVMEIPYPEYEIFFSEYDHYREYFGLD